jgi:TrpR family trp operon transcriptional repressor
MNALNELSAALVSVKDRGNMLKFLSEIHTPSELKDLALRWRLLKMLTQGYPQREIAGKLKISLCKITRGSRLLKSRGSVTKELIKG